ncbi:hypothetical protein B0H13DRAFT_2661214 [Mycena leptocephala]|nr:hypothetical protein B0H13DRAFT_2661214 [Mycena leptocephala]
MDGPSALPVTSHFLKPEQRFSKNCHISGARIPTSRLHLCSSTLVVSGDLHAGRRVTPCLHLPHPARPLLAGFPPRIALRIPRIDLLSHLPAKVPADELRNRRTRKMARIVRTLGESVPAELVFPATQADPPRRPSTLSKRRSTRLLRASSAAMRTGRRDSLVESEWRRETAPAVEWEREREAPPVPEAEPDSSDRDSVSVYSALSGEPPLGPAPEPAKFGARTAPVVFEPLAPTSSRSHASLAFQPRAAGPSAAPTDIGYDRGTHRREQGWSGEWVTMGEGLQNMNEVASRLRDLRLK